MAYTSAPFTHVPSGQPSAVQYAPQYMPDTSRRLGSSVPLHTAAEWHTSAASSPSPSTLYSQYPSSPDSPSTSASSPPSSRASSPGSSSLDSPRPKKKCVSRRSAKDPSHIPRPRNAFILFRSAMCEELRKDPVETDHRMISRIIGKVWKTLDATTKEYYNHLAAQEKEEHSRLYPGYRFNPQARIAPPKRRNVKRNGKTDRLRCDLIADILNKGNSAKLKEEVDQFDKSVKQQMSRDAPCEAGNPHIIVFDSNPSTPLPSSPSSVSTSSETPFRSPLLPPVRSESGDADVQDQADPLSSLHLGPENPFDMSSPPHPSPEMVDSTINVFSQPSPLPGFGAMLSQEQGILGISDMYPPTPQFDPATISTNPLNFQHQQFYSADLSFHEPPSYNLDASAPMPEAHLQMASYQPGFQPQPFPQPQGHPHAQYVDPLSCAPDYSGNFGIPTPYDTATQGVYPGMWPCAQVGELESEPAHFYYLPF